MANRYDKRQSERNEVIFHKKYEERISNTESCQRMIDTVMIFILIAVSVTMFVLNNHFCNAYLSWLAVSAAVTCTISCIGVVYHGEDNVITGCIMVVIAVAVGIGSLI